MINLYFQCAACMEELQNQDIDMSPDEYQSISVGLTSEHRLQVWCERHQRSVITLDLTEEQRKLFGHEVCEVCKCSDPPTIRKSPL